MKKSKSKPKAIACTGKNWYGVNWKINNYSKNDLEKKLNLYQKLRYEINDNNFSVSNKEKFNISIAVLVKINNHWFRNSLRILCAPIIDSSLLLQCGIL